MFHAITDGVVMVRPPERGDAAKLIAGRDAEWERWLGSTAASDDPEPFACIVVGGEVVGWIDYDTDRDWLYDGEVNIGYNVFAPYRGRGYASRALTLVLRYLDQSTEFDTATLLIHPDNAASLAVAAKSRFEPSGFVDGSRYFKRLAGATPRWQYGDIVVRREICWGRPCFAIPVRVVEDSDYLLATYIPERTPMHYAEYPDLVWPTETGRHPWWPREEWRGHGVLMLQRPGDNYAVWHFWGGDDRHFESWYLNIQEPFRRTPIGYDTQDMELDVIVLEDGQWFFKDEEAMDGHLRSGRYTTAEVDAALRTGREIAAMLDAGERWWDDALRSWHPDPTWTTPARIVDGWQSVEWTTGTP